MTGFNNQCFRSLVDDLINDAFYLESRSRRGTIATVRQYGEVIVRKILDYSHQEHVMLGDRNIVNELKSKSNDNPLLIDSIRKIKNIGNKCTHTQDIFTPYNEIKFNITIIAHFKQVGYNVKKCYQKN